MKKVLKSSLLALSLASLALLSACGGGDAAVPTSAAQAASQPAWGSPALLVPVGSSQTSIALSGCRDASLDRLRKADSVLQARGVAVESNPVNSPSLVITSAGDVIFSGALGTATVASELTRVNFGSNVTREIEIDVDATKNILDVQDTVNRIYVSGNAASPFSASNATQSFSCSSVGTLTLAIPPSEARLAAKFTTGLTQLSVDESAATPILNNQAAWYNVIANAGNPMPDSSIQYAGLNIATGALTVGSSLANVTTSVPLLLTGATAGKYRETYNLPNGAAAASQEVEFVATTTQNTLKFLATAQGNLLSATPVLGTPNIILPVLPPVLLP